jgi:transposase
MTGEIRRLRELAGQGLHRAAIARELGRTPTFVSDWIDRLGLSLKRLRPKTRRRRPPDANWEWRQTARTALAEAALRRTMMQVSRGQQREAR